MINFGNILLYLTFISCLFGFLSGFYKIKIQTLANNAFLQFSLLTIALLKLVNAHINSDYRFLNVLENSHELIPTLYKVTGVWANHEGSMLLLVWAFSLITLLFSCRNRFTENLTKTILSTQSLIVLYLLVIILFSSNPFDISDDIFPRGRGFNPLLQDIGLTIHPPILYLGYAGISIPFSISIGMLLNNSLITQDLLKKIHPWVLAPWALLSCGIGLGSWWAYRELGWGGFWFWDPVENVSLIVWLASTIAIHSMRISINHSSCYRWLLGINIITFLLSIFGMFLVRSGVLVSVHSFAFDLDKGQLIFAIFLLLAIPSIFIFSKRSQNIKKGKEIELGLNKKTAILSNNILLGLACIVVILGVLYPLLSTLFSQKIVSVDESFYAKTLSIFFIPLIYIAGLYSAQNIKKITLSVSMSLIIVLIINYYYPIKNYLIGVYIHAAIFLLLSILIDLKNLDKDKNRNISMILGHLGFAVLIAGGALYYAYQFSEIVSAEKNKIQNVKNYQLELLDIEYIQSANYLSRKALIEIKYNNQKLGTLTPEIRFYPIEKSFTIESAILHIISGDIYLTLGELNDKKIVIEIQFKPFIYMLWTGVFLMLLSVVLNFISRRNEHIKIVR